jgi:hypothetical protein
MRQHAASTDARASRQRPGEAALIGHRRPRPQQDSLGAADDCHDLAERPLLDKVFACFGPQRDANGLGRSDDLPRDRRLDLSLLGNVDEDDVAELQPLATNSMAIRGV